MINVEKVKFNERCYYVPSYTGCSKVSVIKPVNEQNSAYWVQAKKNNRFIIGTQHIYETPEAATRGRRAWEKGKRKKSERR